MPRFLRNRIKKILHTAFAMNNNSTEIDNYEYENLVKRSLAKLNKIRYADMAFVPVSFLAIITNTLVILMILKHSKLRVASQFLVSQLAIADWLVGAAFLSMAVKRLIRFYSRIPEVNTQAGCFAEMWLNYFSQTASITIALAIAFERLLATATAVFYRQNIRRIVGWLTTVAWLYPLLESAFMFYGVSFKKMIPNCILVVAMTPQFHAFQSYNKLFQVCLMMTFYAGIMISIKHQVELAKKQNKSVAAVKKRTQAKIARMLGVVAVLYLVCQIATRIGLVIVSRISVEIKGTVTPFMMVLVVVNSGANFFIYISLSSEYKEAFKNLTGKSTMFLTKSTVPGVETRNRTAAGGSRAVGGESRKAGAKQSRKSTVTPANPDTQQKQRKEAWSSAGIRQDIE